MATELFSAYSKTNTISTRPELGTRSNPRFATPYHLRSNFQQRTFFLSWSLSPISKLRSAMPRRQSSHLQNSLEVEPIELVESTLLVRSSVLPIPAPPPPPLEDTCSILATRRLSMRDLGLGLFCDTDTNDISAIDASSADGSEAISRKTAITHNLKHETTLTGPSHSTSTFLKVRQSFMRT